ncbi:MAG TPA: hypothetical protein VJU81_16015 [Methylomirabilota bacterium]|nr:hypothetical protein [Methylomirabilota bacterium]
MGRFISVAALVLVTLVAAAPPAPAQSLDPASAEALAAVLRMLQDPVARGAGIAANPEAAAIDRNMRAMTGGSSALMDEFYVLVAEVFTDLVQGSGGDLTRMQKSLAEGQRDPAGFAAFLSPATLQHLRDLSSRITDQKR